MLFRKIIGLRPKLGNTYYHIIQECFVVRNWLVMMKFAFRVNFTRPLFSKWLPTKLSNCQWSPISMKIDFQEYFEVRNWLVMMKLTSTCPNSDMWVVWGLLCLHPNTLHPNTIKPRYTCFRPSFLWFVPDLFCFST